MRADPVAINMSGISVSGVGGLGLVVVAALMTWTFPQAWWIEVLGAVGGTFTAIGIVIFRRVHVPSGPSGDDPRILFRAAAPSSNRPASRGVRTDDLSLASASAR